MTRVFIASFLLANSSAVLSGQTDASFAQEPAFKTLFLSKQTRDKIDQQRQAYLHPVIEKKVKKITPKVSGKPRVKRVYIPPKVEVSAVIIKPDGSTLIRVNDRYNRSPSKHIKMDFMHTTSEGVPVTVKGKTKVVPVGSTLLTRQVKLVKTYKLDQQAKKAALPKTVQKAVKTRLEQVQILTPKE